MKSVEDAEVWYLAQAHSEGVKIAVAWVDQFASGKPRNDSFRNIIIDW